MNEYCICVLITVRFQSLAGYSSHHYNPFVALVRPETTESAGEAWGFNLVYSGSFAVDVERDFHGNTRVLLGMNPLHLSWPLAPGETFDSPECVAVYSSAGLGGMSRVLHDLYRHNLSRSKHTLQPRPALLNNWEATYFDMGEDNLLPIAETAGKLGVRMFVMDDGWFGDKHGRINEHAGLGDWVVNPKRFPNGLGSFVDKVTSFGVSDATNPDAKLKFGLWVEPEMVNPKSELYEAHPDWALHAPGQDRTEGRYQLVLNLGLRDVQDYIILVIGDILASADISYVKWDNNRAMHELAHPSDAHRYILGMYRVLDTLCTRFPDVLWEGCASGGGRFDAGLLYYWPQHWASDNTDAHDRLHIQFGATLAYPASSMGCHVSVVPNHNTGRVTPLAFRAHVAMMGGGFGFELDLNKIPADERAMIPGIVTLSEEINPIVVAGDMYRLATPWESNWPAAQYMATDGSKGVVLIFQIRDTLITDFMPFIKLQGLDKAATYEVEVIGHKDDQAEKREASGEELLVVGMRWRLRGEYQSRVVKLNRK
jgi:alpha-galactosidase